MLPQHQTTALRNISPQIGGMKTNGSFGYEPASQESLGQVSKFSKGEARHHRRAWVYTAASFS